ncbi:MAG: transcription-repair coupling factor, partial [Gammaproteobacteria bacterium]
TTLAKIPALKRSVIVVPVTTVIHRLLPRDYLSRHSLQLKIGQKVDIEMFKSDLISAGYSFSSQVMEHGDAAIRGSLFDIYPMGSRKPYRIDLFDDEIDSIRTFDPETQRSEGQINEINILPAREIDLTDKGIANFRSSWRERFQGNPGACPVYRDVSQGLAPAGIEYFAPRC